ncbi:MAG: glycosyltransferase [Bacteroidota bacterium]
MRDLRDREPDTVTVIRLQKNYGQNAATLCGIHHANGSRIITLDDDLQTPPEEIPKLLEAAESEGYDVVFGVPPRQEQPWIRRVGSAMIKKLFRAIDGSGIGSSFRLINTPVIANLQRTYHEHLFINQVLHWYTSDIGYVDVAHAPRQDGQSGYSLGQLFGIAWRLLVYYTDFPLRLMVTTGLLIALVCFGLGTYYIYQKFAIGAELGFTSIIVAIFFATGLILTWLSVLGIYINRNYASRIRKPAYAIKAKH